MTERRDGFLKIKKQLANLSSAQAMRMIDDLLLLADDGPLPKGRKYWFGLVEQRKFSH